MLWTELEKGFNRAFSLSFSRKKLALAFPVLAACGVLVVFCRALAYEANGWVEMSLLFLPIFISSGILLALGVLLIRIHHHEAKQLTLNFKELLYTSMDLILGASYLSILPTLAYLCLWIFMGIFLLLQMIPVAGDFFSVVFSFGPFLLIFGSILLCLLNLALLFFIAPAIALHSLKTIPLAKRVFEELKKKMLSSILLFLIGFLPLGFIGFLLSRAAELTNVHFLIADHSLSVALEWFFIMLPFCAILTPFIVFFFNFSAESYQLLQESRQQQTKCE